MNATKLERIKREVDTADIEMFELIDKKLHLQNNLSHNMNSEVKRVPISTLISKDELLNEEQAIYINKLCYRLALICEHYLKAITIYNMHFDDVENESKKELEIIFSNKAKNGGIASFGHNLEKLIFDNKYLNLSTKYSIIYDLIYKVKNRIEDKELISLFDNMKNQMNSLMIDYNNGNNEVKKDIYIKMGNLEQKLFEKIRQIVNNNSNAFAKARYAMYEIELDDDKYNDVTYDIDFLYDLASTLQLTIQKVIDNSLYIEPLNRHIFYDLNTDITLTFKNDDIETIHVMNINNVINEYKRIMFSRIFKTNNFVSTYDESFLSNVELKKVNYVENGINKILCYDIITDNYIITR